jgi:histidinol-phosphate aminotransferase
MTALRTHGGPDALGAPQHDFSTNSNACGPCPQALEALRQADACHYPDASYTRLRQQLAAFHGVPSERVLLAGSASEFIFRITAWVARSGSRCAESGASPVPAVHLPPHAYGDYGQAAQAWGLAQAARPEHAALVWACEPTSPLGQAHQGWPPSLLEGCRHPLPATVLDAAYAPLRLSGVPSLGAAQLSQVWQLFTPNKALGLTGVRAAYVIAPLGAQDAVRALEALAPSWPVGAHGVAMLQAWVGCAVQAWLAGCLPVLREWKARQQGLLQGLGWRVAPSQANFFCAQPPQPLDLAHLRQVHGIKLRDASSFGLPGQMRLGVLPPASQDVLHQALQTPLTILADGTHAVAIQTG